MSSIRKMTDENGVLVYGNDIINYNIIRNSTTKDSLTTNKKRKISIKVHPDKRVVAIVPC